MFLSFLRNIFICTIICSTYFVSIKNHALNCESKVYPCEILEEKMDLRDTWDLRFRNKDIFDKTNDDEVLFLITDMSWRNFPDMPFGYLTTGCVIIPRIDRVEFRKIFLSTYPANEYKKCTMSDFNVLQRKYHFNIDGKVQHFFFIQIQSKKQKLFEFLTNSY